jgi:hypothetical protein
MAEYPNLFEICQARCTRKEVKTLFLKKRGNMKIYRAEGLDAFTNYEKAAAEEYAVAHELAQCAKVEVYELLAVDLFQRVKESRLKTAIAFEKLKNFEDDLVTAAKSDQKQKFG